MLTSHTPPTLERERTTELVVAREGEPRGRLWWRRARYTVFSVAPDGARTRVLSGDFRNHAAALRAARTRVPGQ